MTHYCVTVGGANGGSRDTLGKALDGYASKGKVRRVVGYSQQKSKKSFAEGYRVLDFVIDELMVRGDTFELMGGSMGCEIISEWLWNNAKRPDAPTTSELTKITFIGNPARAKGGVFDGFIGQFGYQPDGRRRPSPVTQYRTDDIARVRDGWCNSDAWAESPLKKPSKLALLTGRLIDHSVYDDVSIATAKLRAVVGETRYWVHA